MNRTVCVLFTLVLAVLTMFAVASLPGLQLSDDHQLMLKSSVKEYSEYLQFKKSFPHEQQELIVVLEGELWNTAGIGRLQSAVQALQALDTVQGVATVLDVPWVDQTVRAFKAGDQQAMPAIKTKLSNSAYLPSRFVADDFNVNTFTIALTTPAVESRRLLLLANKDIREVLDNAFENELQWKIAGYPALRIALIEQIRSDSLIYGGLAFLFAAVVAFLFLRSLKLVVVSLLAPVLAVVWTLALLAVFGVSINPLNQMVVVMVLVVSYSDAMHLLIYLRQPPQATLTTMQSMHSAVKVVLPACLMTSLTTGVGFASLGLSESFLIRQFGLACATGAVVGFIVIALSTPVLAWTVRNIAASESRLVGLKCWAVSSYSDRIILVSGLLVTAALVVTAFQLRPGYQLGENLPSDHEFSRASRLADTRLGGVLPLHMMVEWKNATDVSDTQKLRDIRKIRRLLQESTQLQWVSAVDLLRFSSGFNSASRLELLPDQVVARVLNRTDGRALLTTQLAIADSGEFNALFTRLNSVAFDIAEQLPGTSIKLNGLLPLLNATSQSMIGDLMKSLVSTFIVVGLMMWIVFRSWRLALLLVIPNIAPLAGVATALVCFNQPLRYASVVVFSICLGIVIDDSIHITHRYLVYRKAGLPLNRAVEQAMHEVGRVLVLTTLILLGGFLALVFGSNPTVSLIGLLLITGLCIALMYDLLLLPPLLRRFHR